MNDSFGKFDRQSFMGSPDPSEYRGTPDSVVSGNHDFTLQTVIEMQKPVADIQKSIGDLTATSRGIQASIDKQDRKLEKAEEELAGISKRVYAATIILSAVLAFGVFLGTKYWDLIFPPAKITPTSINQPSPSAKP